MLHHDNVAAASCAANASISPPVTNFKSKVSQLVQAYNRMSVTTTSPLKPTRRDCIHAPRVNIAPCADNDTSTLKSTSNKVSKRKKSTTVQRYMPEDRRLLGQAAHGDGECCKSDVALKVASAELASPQSPRSVFCLPNEEVRIIATKSVGFNEEDNQIFLVPPRSDYSKHEHSKMFLTAVDSVRIQYDIESGKAAAETPRGLEPYINPDLNSRIVHASRKVVMATQRSFSDCDTVASLYSLSVTTCVDQAIRQGYEDYVEAYGGEE